MFSCAQCPQLTPEAQKINNGFLFYSCFSCFYIRPLACLFDWLEAAGVRSWERLCSGVGLTQVLHSSNAWELPDSLRKAVISLPYTEINPLGPEEQWGLRLWVG